jgi:hypothetical protein
MLISLGALVAIGQRVVRRRDILDMLRVAEMVTRPPLYACVLLSIAISGFVLWLVPSRGWSIAISIATIVIGIVAGVLWERRSS